MRLLRFGLGHFSEKCRTLLRKMKDISPKSMLYFRVKNYDLVFPLCGNLYTMSREDILGTSVLNGSLMS